MTIIKTLRFNRSMSNRGILQMTIVSNFSESIWKREEEKFKNLESTIKIPDKELKEVDMVELCAIEDFEKILDRGGCYWIWTNEPVNHSFHRNKTPEKIYGGEIIYNGIAKDNIRPRVKHHLKGEEDAGWSGISMDILFSKPVSHRKKVFSTKGRVKVPYLNGEPLRSKALLFKLQLSAEEKKFIEDNAHDEYFFRNGINIFEPKHKKYKFRVYYIAGLKSLYLEFIEKKWREKFGLPKLCSYSSGR